tara:strand:+ start:70 stop:1218 length:1149 start_codon:yes stop_codon:yes gene_type:complete
MPKSYLKQFIPLEKTIKNNKCKYLSKGKKLTQKNIERLKNIYIPPAYQNLLLSKSPNNKVQVIGEDSCGRKQYIYNSNHVKKIEKRKYNKLQQLLPIITQIENSNRCKIDIIYQYLLKNKLSNLDEKQTGSQLETHTQILKFNLGLTKNELIQIIIFLLISTNLRIGCMKYCKLYNSYGLTTLLPEHLFFKKQNNTYQLKFIGKKGIENIGNINDNKIINILHHMIKRVMFLQTQFPNAKHLFQYVYHNPISNTYNLAIISSNDIMTYFENNYNTVITPKMFRTWYANYHMINFIKEIINNNNNDFTIQELKNIKGCKLNKYLKKEIPLYVSQKLNNTPNVCKNKYINNVLFNNIVENPNYYIKKIKTEPDTNKLLQSLLSK